MPAVCINRSRQFCRHEGGRLPESLLLLCSCPGPSPSRPPPQVLLEGQSLSGAQDSPVPSASRSDWRLVPAKAKLLPSKERPLAPEEPRQAPQRAGREAWPQPLPCIGLLRRGAGPSVAPGLRPGCCEGTASCPPGSHTAPWPFSPRSSQSGQQDLCIKEGLTGQGGGSPRVSSWGRDQRSLWAVTVSNDGWQTLSKAGP